LNLVFLHGPSLLLNDVGLTNEFFPQSLDAFALIGDFLRGLMNEVFHPLSGPLQFAFERIDAIGRLGIDFSQFFGRVEELRFEGGAVVAEGEAFGFVFFEFEFDAFFALFSFEGGGLLLLGGFDGGMLRRRMGGRLGGMFFLFRGGFAAAFA